MLSLTCPVPNNINPLQSTGFMFTINKLPEISFFCQEANIPEITLPTAEFENRFSVVPVAGDKPQFGDLFITFLIDEGMENYVAVHNWLVGLGFPKDTNQYSSYIESHRTFNQESNVSASVSDGVLQILNSSNNTTRTIQFIDLVPVSLTSLQLQSTVTETTYLAGNAVFKYNYYEFV